MLPDQTQSESRVTAGAAGVGAGTVLALFATSLPDGSPAKKWLLLVAPTVSVTSAAVWAWVRIRIATYIHEAEIRLLIRSAKRGLREQLHDAELLDTERTKILDTIAELRGLEISRYVERIKELQPIQPSARSQSRKSDGQRD
jgi:hypothetical protein